MMSDASDVGSDASSKRTPVPTCWDHLARTLNNIKSIGDFAAMRRYQHAPNPVLQVGDDIIPLPLHDRDAQSIKKLARQAPFGKGNQTIVDVSVRRTWELSVDNFSLKNPSWSSFLDKILKNVCENLGIVESIDAQPHKLLLYEQGSFFMPHKDSQKVEGMIATLAVCLPSQHEGGEVHLSHAGQKRTFDTSEASLFDTTALAWFSDVTHEVRKVVSGYRLVLTYNIIHRSGSKLSASAFDQQLETVDGALSQCRLQSDKFLRRIYPLDHKYSRAGLSLRDLKGRDRAVCQSLYKLCSRHGFYLLLSHMTRQDSNYPDEYGGENDEVDLSLDVINGPDGAELAKEIMFLEDELIVDPYSNRTEDAFEESEHLGNEESPEIFKYYDTAAIICPKTAITSYLHLKENVNAINMMLMVMHDNEENPNAIGAPGDSLTVLEKIVESPPLRLYHNYNHSRSRVIYERMIEWAWERNYQTLYFKSVLSSMTNRAGSKGMETVAKIINADTSEADDKAAINWDKYFGAAIDEVQSLTCLDKSLAEVGNAIVEGLKPSFSTWKSSVVQDKFSSKTCLGIEDEKVIISRLDNTDWVTDCLIPALSERGTKRLITRLVQGLLENKPEETQTNATETASKVLQSTYSKVALDTTDFDHDYFEYTSANKFIGLLARSLTHGLKSNARQLLDATWTNIDETHKDTGSTSLKRPKQMIPSLLHSLGRLLREHEVSYLDSTRQLFSFLICRYMCQGKEFEQDLKAYKDEVTAFERPFVELRNEYMKGLLGDVVYRELIMLEGIEGSKGAQQLASAAATAGTKRAADDTLDNLTSTKILRPEEE
ncbi:hypothetical protein NPX13_g6487 [Xylaria arbuscula]|uniref:Prolyl 4-hydroxylase alpha subunit Fe(2+) 2OG dioxygenase domain-containing protein n=1 Tax=Xylaria arbuscula TaxID=114810 RepID=A0A9W8NBR7_9PEZI|nr:hypothetical protein NPX13_g6487 [Xylaria arbuscula]